MSDHITIVDLFAGAGGLSTGAVQACRNMGLSPEEGDVELHAINHDEDAIATHRQNHSWAEHYHAKIEELHPPNVVEPGTTDLLQAGPSCTHHSNARGGKPVREQKRASAWTVLKWVEMLQPENLLIENVKEFRSWAPIEDGECARDGSIFQQFITTLQEALNYDVNYDVDDDEYGVVLNAADYGEAQSRDRLFLLASKDGRPTAPEPTHDNENPVKPDRRTAADIIDWSDLGTSIWTRDLEHARVQPLSSKTMGRIAEGIRRHCDEQLAPFASVLEELDADALERLRETPIPAEHAGAVAQLVDEPFLVRTSAPTTAATSSVVKLYGTSTVSDIDAPLGTVTSTGNHLGLSTAMSYVLGQHSNSVPRDVTERPVPTIAKSGNIHLCTSESVILRQQSGGVPKDPSTPLPTVAKSGAISMASMELDSLVLPRDGARRGPHSNPAYPAEDRPLHTVTAQNHDGHVLTPSLIHYSHGGRLRDVDAPMPTIATEKGGAFGLAMPYLAPMYNGRSNQRPRTRTIDRPLLTIPASKSPAGLTAPFLVEYYGNSTSTSVDEPLPTVTTRDRFALVLPELWPYGLDVKYRMLQPRELKQAQGFPEDYELAGDTKKSITSQIGNAVPVSLAESLVTHLLTDDTPSLSTYGGGVQSDGDGPVPDYEEVLAEDD